MEIVKYILYSLVFIYTANWIQINNLLPKFIQSKKKLISLNNPQLINKLKEKTGINFLIKLMESNRMIGFMPGLPFKPLMVLSDKLYKNLNKDELEWVILHEAGHCFHWHTLKMVLIQLLSFISGLILINIINYIFFVPFIAVLMAIAYIKIEKFFEYEADWFAIKRMDRPEAMITANKKMGKFNARRVFMNNIWMRRLFFIGVWYEDRIKFATKYLEAIENN